MGNSILERVAFLEKNLAAVLDLVMTFSEKLEEKFSQANINEKERLKSLFKLLNIKMSEHDEAEEARFVRFGVRNREASNEPE
jgi:methionine-rich copper-binding protein CopC